MLDQQEIIKRLKTFLRELEKCQSLEGLKFSERLEELKDDINCLTKELEIPDTDIRGISHLVKTIKQVLGCGFLNKEEVDYIMGEVREAIDKLENLSNKNVFMSFNFL